MEINKHIDHTLLKPTATSKDIKILCEEAKTYKFYAVCVNPFWVKYAVSQVQDSHVKVAAVVGFPLGASKSTIKVAEAKEAVMDGAEEIDMVINHALLAEGNYEDFVNEISEIKKAIGEVILKVIIETCYLTNEQIRKASELSVKAGADFVKTSTGFGTGGATFEHIQIMKDAVNGKAQLKASGGVRDYNTAKQYVDMGVSRLGTSSGVAIVEGKTSESDY